MLLQAQLTSSSVGSQEHRFFTVAAWNDAHGESLKSYMYSIFISPLCSSAYGGLEV